MDNFVPLVISGLSSSSNSTSAPTSRPKDQSNSSGESATLSDPVTTRSAKRACGKPMQTNPDKLASGNRGPAHKKDEMNEKDPTQSIPDWLQPCTDNLEDLGTHVFAHSSEREISDPEGDASKVETHKRKHSFCTRFPKDRNCDKCFRAKIMRVPCRRRDEGSIPRAEKFGDLITTDHKVLNEGSESRNNHRYAVVVQDLATQLIQSFSCKKQKIRRRLRRVYESFESRHRSQKFFTRPIHWNLASLVKNYHGIIERPRLVTQKQTEFAERTVRRVKEGTSAVLLQSGLDEKWSSVSMECYCFLRNVPRPPGRRENSV